MFFPWQALDPVQCRVPCPALESGSAHQKDKRQSSTPQPAKYTRLLKHVQKPTDRFHLHNKKDVLFCKKTKKRTVNLHDSFSEGKQTFFLSNEFLVSKETVVLRRWERSKQKFGFIKRVKSLELFHGGNSTFINSFDKTKFLFLFISLGPVARSMVRANHWLRGIETYTFLW